MSFRNATECWVRVRIWEEKSARERDWKKVFYGWLFPSYLLQTRNGLGQSSLSNLYVDEVNHVICMIPSLVHNYVFISPAFIICPSLYWVIFFLCTSEVCLCTLEVWLCTICVTIVSEKRVKWQCICKAFDIFIFHLLYVWVWEINPSGIFLTCVCARACLRQWRPRRER